MKYFHNVLETIGNTPLVKLNKVLGPQWPCLVLAKVETTNPGNSIKDRMAVKMIDDALASGRLKPGGTIIEGTSGNTGMGLAIVAAVKGYKCIFTTNDKQSKEKVDLLKAVGAEVIVCPTNVAPTDPRSYYSVAKRLSEQIPNSVYLNQYDNLSNRQAHYEQTGPEIWSQTEGKITHLVVGVGTGGTISGVGKYLKERNPNIQVYGIDTYGSVFKKYHETGIFDEKEIYSYVTEGIGEDILPENVDFDVIDLFEKVSDKDGLLYQRRLAREEGILVGNSAGSAVAGLVQLASRFKPGDVVVVIFHDHGSRYVGKAYNDDWMRERGFLDDNLLSLADIIKYKPNTDLITIGPSASVADALKLIGSLNISQIPVVQGLEFVGSVSESKLFRELMGNPDLKFLSVENVMDKPLPILREDSAYGQLTQLLDQGHGAALIALRQGGYGIITKHDVIYALTKMK
ncbi:MAG: pyridoxal-phosphate dependent enzyme [Bacteroidetes bacterium]|jgi:cystathionine beta-synthase|nr:pyridoxal-phosphate dependent enzyme [Bacteroidota bacterium]